MYGLFVGHLRYDADGIGYFGDSLCHGHLADVGTDGTLYTFGSREQMQALADDLARQHVGRWTIVPLPWPK